MPYLTYDLRTMKSIYSNGLFIWISSQFRGKIIHSMLFRMQVAMHLTILCLFQYLILLFEICLTCHNSPFKLIQCRVTLQKVNGLQWDNEQKWASVSTNPALIYTDWILRRWIISLNAGLVFFKWLSINSALFYLLSNLVLNGRW